MKACGRRYREGDVLLVVVGVLLAMGSIGAGALLGQVPRSKAEVMPADAVKVSPGGATFKVPAGWSLETAKNLEVLTPPETDTHVAIFDGEAAADAKSAVVAAWAALKGGQTHSLKIVTPRPAREGWDDRQVFEYETSPNERAVIEAVALRAGARWTVLLIDGTDPTVEKRSAPLGLVIQSLRPKGYLKESFTGLQGHSLDAERVAQLQGLETTRMITTK